MGMTINDATLYMELYKRKLFDSVSDLDKDIEAYNVAIDTMKKYQKIEQIIAMDDENHRRTIKLCELKEVLDNGR